MNKRIGTVGFIIENNKVLLALINYSEDKVLWNGIGGFVNEGESPKDALVREVSEETFIQIHKDDIYQVKELDGEIILMIYKIDKWSGEIKSKDPSIIDLKWFTFDEIPFSKMHDGNEDWFPELLSYSSRAV